VPICYANRRDIVTHAVIDECVSIEGFGHSNLRKGLFDRHHVPRFPFVVDPGDTVHVPINVATHEHEAEQDVIGMDQIRRGRSFLTLRHHVPDYVECTRVRVVFRVRKRSQEEITLHKIAQRGVTLHFDRQGCESPLLMRVFRVHFAPTVGVELFTRRFINRR